MLPKLYLVPVYIGSLKYYEKLIPRLEGLYDVRFLFVRGNDSRRKQMEKYSKEKGYKFEIIEEGLNKSSPRVPLVTPFLKRYVHIRACRIFFENTKPEKLIVTKTVPPHDILAREAKRVGTELMLLQWSSWAPPRASDESQRKLFIFQKIYYTVFDFFRAFLDSMWGGTTYKGFIQPNKIGVIDLDAARGYAKLGFSKDTIHIVGTIDHQLAHDIRRQIVSDSGIQNKLENKYGLTQEKTKIVVLSYRFHKAKVGRKTEAEQVEYFYNIKKMIRNEFPDAEILFKLHPAEDKTMYTEYEKLGVKIYADEADTAELMCLSDLCVLDPWTTAVYFVLGGSLSALFVNLSSLKYLNSIKDYYGIKNIVSTEEELAKALKQFKQGKLKNQYDNSHIDVRSIDKIITFIN